MGFDLLLEIDTDEVVFLDLELVLYGINEEWQLAPPMCVLFGGALHLALSEIDPKLCKYAPGFLKAVRSLCSQYNVLLILDEVATGFGRTGTMFACEQEGVAPDLLCLAKGLTGGYLPLAVTLTTQQIFDGFCAPYEEKKAFFHGHSYTANPLACAAAIANLQCFQREQTVRRLQPKIALLRRELEALRSLPHVGDIRQVGFMVGIEMMRDSARGEPYPYEAKTGIRTILEARRRGLIIRPLGDVIVLMPPLSISQRDIVRMVHIVRDSIVTATEK